MIYQRIRILRQKSRTDSRFCSWVGACASLVLIALARPAHAAPASGADTWVAIDGLGRTMPTNDDVGDPRAAKTVGIFYYMWHQRSAGDIYDISKIIAQDPAPWGPSPAFHWWGEPQLGYYEINDEFVLRKHAQMLSDAGVDLVTFDVTNAYTYDSTYQKICSIYQDIRAHGGRTPQISFIAYSSSDATVQKLYDSFYAKGTCSELWFRWLGKPLIFAAPGALTPPVSDFFTFRSSWAWSNGSWFGDGHDKWPWLDNYPQNYGWHDAPNVPEEIVAGIAQHPSGNYGRSYHAGAQPAVGANGLTPDTAKGLGFAEQWQRALQVDPPFVFVTQWNEWIAQRFIRGCNPDSGIATFLGQPLACGGTYFIDEYNQEYSRDAEPMRGGHGDAYYYQLAENVRKYKGAQHVAYASPARVIDAQGSFTQWQEVRPVFDDDVGDVTHRDAQAFAGPLRYQNTSGRNDITLAKVARSETNVCFYARTADALSPSTDANWMELLVDTDGDLATGWNGYELLVDRTRTGQNASIERYAGTAFDWSSAGTAPFHEEKNELALCLPRALLGSAARLALNFKWIDNLPATPTPADFIDQGDVAPNGRFAYHFEEPVLRWDFAGSAEGWGGAHALTLNAENGTLTAALTGADPFFLSPNHLEIDAAYRYLTVRLKNQTADTAAQLYFSTDADPNFDEKKEIELPIAANATDFSDYTFDLSTLPTWTGVIRQVRLDPAANASTGNVVIDSIAFSAEEPRGAGGSGGEAGAASEGGAGSGESARGGGAGAGVADAGVGASTTAAGHAAGGATGGPANTPENGSNCACRSARARSSRGPLLSLLLFVASAVARRRRRS